MLEYTPDEIMVVCMSRQIMDGEIVAQGLATPLVTAAYLLAKQTHAPNLYFASAIGQGVCRQPAPLSVANIEKLWLDRSLNCTGFIRAVADVLPRLQPKEFFRPAQVDRHGNFNNIAFGRDYMMPRFRLPGTGGIPDVSTYNSDIHLYVPRHSRLTFVEKLDFLSGLGHHQLRRQGNGPVYLITDLGEFDFVGQDNSSDLLSCIRLVSYHPGVSIEQIQSKTGFPLIIHNSVKETTSPSQEELRLLREEIDPLGTRRLELMSGSDRRLLLHDIIMKEMQEKN
jgi:acyl CoA:acetate/3-ketoacid CoA transferase beta subunit